LNFLVDWRRFTIESRLTDGKPGAVGFHLRNTEKQRTSLLFAQTVDSYSPSRKTGYETLRVRHYDQLLGIRSTHAFGKRKFQFELYSDIRRGNGLKSVITMAQRKQYGIWSISGQLGTTYTSSGNTNYYYGITIDEANEIAPAYQPGRSISTSASVSATAPVNDFMIFRAKYKTTRLPDNIVDSPLVKSQYAYEFSMGIFFTFGTP